MGASAGNASEPYPPNSRFVCPGFSPAGRPAARTLRRRLNLNFFLLQATGGYARSPARACPLFLINFNLCFFHGGRDANHIRTENAPTRACVAWAESKATVRT